MYNASNGLAENETDFFESYQNQRDREGERERGRKSSERNRETKD